LNAGHLAAITAYILWGLFPFYWKLLKAVGPFEVICHRIVWSFLALSLGVYVSRRAIWPQWQQFRRDRRNYLASLLAAVLIGTNWLVFIWAVHHNAVVESALGYFITPLMNVALGVLIFGERLPRIQWLAIALAAIGVAYLTIRLGRIPYLALTLASSFAFYGIVKKRMSLTALPGLWLETAILLPLALSSLAWLAMTGEGRFGAIDRWTDLLIMGGGPTTAIPLLLFAYGAQRIPFSQLGLLQYIAPSIQFLVGWLAFAEPVDPDRWLGFSCVWCGLLIFALSVRRPRVAAATR
jgi:chloramphenicol-sensitive protein RarD